ncbi:hypothetical protein DBV15_11036 [Temnothorax longispinosus]|uniref:Uncharacterized protein n=1 Tax=Temnothorax longispinosus TaxID=300112 RepID=A0A4S2KRK8_9HYME|nr:hypothetical protein DBV15_11036 [Temnothorax longispinosus]
MSWKRRRGEISRKKARTKTPAAIVVVVLQPTSSLGLRRGITMDRFCEGGPHRVFCSRSRRSRSGVWDTRGWVATSHAEPTGHTNVQRGTAASRRLAESRGAAVFTGIKDPWLVYVSVSDGREERRGTVERIVWWSPRPAAVSNRRCHIDSQYRTENTGSHHLSQSRSRLVVSPDEKRLRAHVSDAGERKSRESYRRNEFVNEAGHSRASVRLGDSMSGAGACERAV